ncbi:MULTISPECIES: porin family protein [Aquimarina]|uniref:PorT family protein n=1 Tax=Aquimarina algiphila TaxID=2047982 RepID=A0A554VKN1_9FLAO|nr:MULTISPECIES: porin family protein [Aquimarina]TSE08597.1 PorT family protein [Aquimarina algiphila]
MKNVFVFFLLFISCSLFAQEKKITFGVKAGLNYGDNGKIEVADVTSVRADDRVGYHLGVFLRGKLTDNIYLKPELQYTVNNSTYTNVGGTDLDYNIKKLDLPILLGISVLGPIHVFGGPSLQYIVENDLEDVRLGDVKNEFTVGLQFGAGLQLGSFNADIRYERGLSKNRAESIDDGIRVDSRPNQFIIGVSLDL